MDDITLNIYISRILSGIYIFIYRDKIYKLKYPDMNIKYLADLYANKEYEKNRFNDWIIEDDILNLLMTMGIWNPLMETEIKELPKKIEDTKVQLYQNELNPNNLKRLRRILDAHKKRLDFLYGIRHSLDHVTSKGYSNLIKSHYLLSHSFYDENDNKIFTDNDEIDFVLFNNLCNQVTENTIPPAAFRHIARSDLWRNYWSANKDYIFGKPTIDWTDEQKTLVVITKMYDNAYEHTECPSDAIIENDDMFDGWMILLRRENEKERSKRRTEKKFGDKLNKAGEIFLTANSKEEAQDIYGLNNDTSRNIIKERERTINKSEKPIKDSDLPDVQRGLQMQQVQMTKERMKR